MHLCSHCEFTHVSIALHASFEGCALLIGGRRAVLLRVHLLGQSMQSLPVGCAAHMVCRRRIPSVCGHQILSGEVIMGSRVSPQTASVGHRHPCLHSSSGEQCCVPCAAIVGGSAAALALVILLTWLTRREGAWAQRQRSRTERAVTLRRELRGRIANAGAPETEVQPAGARPATRCDVDHSCFRIIGVFALWFQVE